MLQALLLGFGDVRNVLATAAACAAAGAAQGKGGSHPGPQALLFDCCDLSLLNAARGVLLLHLVSSAAVYQARAGRL